jgi:hypothetical protein
MFILDSLNCCRAPKENGENDVYALKAGYGCLAVGRNAGEEVTEWNCYAM